MGPCPAAQGRRTTPTQAGSPSAPGPLPVGVEVVRSYRAHLPWLRNSDLDDPRRDENQQLAALIRHRLSLEQPAQQRELVQPRRSVIRRLLVADVDAADYRRLAVADENR